jgi:3-phenylpropionate/cinnamic acid dioxygenase small subunit
MKLDNESLLVRTALYDVMVSYASNIDDKKWDEYENIFTPDLTVSGVFGDMVWKSRDEWMAHVKGTISVYKFTQHFLGPMKILEFDGDKAKVRVDLQASHFFEGNPKIVFLWGHYETSMKMIDGEWKIYRHELVDYSGMKML